MGLLQAAAWAKVDFPSYCSAHGLYYDCKIGEECNCSIHAKLQGETSIGTFSYKLTPIERKKYQCTFKMSPLSFLINFNHSYFPSGVTYQDEGKSNKDIFNINATAMQAASDAAYVLIQFNFGAYDAPSILSVKCIEKL
jgi:hypothetical protein